MTRHQHWKQHAEEALGLFTQEPPSAKVDTSETAALRIRGKSSLLRHQVLEYIRSRGEFGATEREIEHGLTLPGNTVRPRLWELEGNVPAGRLPRPALIAKSPQKRDGCRVYCVVR